MFPALDIIVKCGQPFFVSPETDAESLASDEEEANRADRNFIVPDDDAEDLEDSTCSPSFYHAFDNADDPPAVASPVVENVGEPYFPRAFAKSGQELLTFDFDNALLDTLTLPAPIQSSAGEDNISCSEPIHFTTRPEAVDYCRQRLRSWKIAARGRQSPRVPVHHHAGVDKRELFQNEGQGLEPYLKTGLPECDGNLHRVREDR